MLNQGSKTCNRVLPWPWLYFCQFFCVCASLILFMQYVVVVGVCSWALTQSGVRTNKKNYRKTQKKIISKQWISAWTEWVRCLLFRNGNPFQAKGRLLSRKCNQALLASRTRIHSVRAEGHNRLTGCKILDESLQTGLCIEHASLITCSK